MWKGDWWIVTKGQEVMFVDLDWPINITAYEVFGYDVTWTLLSGNNVMLFAREMADCNYDIYEVKCSMINVLESLWWDGVGSITTVKMTLRFCMRTSTSGRTYHTPAHCRCVWGNNCIMQNDKALSHRTRWIKHYLGWKLLSATLISIEDVNNLIYNMALCHRPLKLVTTVMDHEEYYLTIY